MKIISFTMFLVAVVFVMLIAALNYYPRGGNAATHNVTLSTDVQTALTFDITQNDTVAFGNLTPGTPIIKPNGPPAGTIATVTTNAANGYTIGISDGSNIDSCLVNAGTYILDYAGNFTTPTVWTPGETGLGVTMYAASNGHKEGKWGTGTTYNDANNKFAGVPAADTADAHVVTGYNAGADTSTWSFQVDVPPDQPSGAYSGAMTFTATMVL